MPLTLHPQVLAPLAVSDYAVALHSTRKDPPTKEVH